MYSALIVDDSALARLTLKRYLEKHDIEVFEAECVADCRYWLKHNKLPDMVFMDITMPGEDGFQGLAEIRSGVNTRDLPVIMYSGDTGEEAKKKAREGQATGFLRKPVIEEHLVSLLDRLDERLRSQYVGVPIEAEVVSRGESDAANAEMVRQELQDLRQSSGRVNIAMEHQRDEISSIRVQMQRQSNDLNHLQNHVNAHDKRHKFSVAASALALFLALVSLVLSLIVLF